MTAIEIRGMSFFHADDGRNPFVTLAFAEVYLPDLSMTLRKVGLTWSNDRGYVAHSPAVKRGDTIPVQWFHRSEFARELTVLLLDMYTRMGGTLPTPAEPPLERRTVPASFTLHEDDSTGLRRVLGVDAAAVEACNVAGL